MPEYKWPDAQQRSLIGKRHDRLDGPAKSTGRAKYTYDINRPGMLFAKAYRCPYAHAKLVSIDTSEAERTPGVKGVRVIKKPGDEIQWQMEEIAVVAAETEEQAEDGVRAIKAKWEKLPHVVKEKNLEEVRERAKPQEAKATGDLAKGFQECDVVHEGEYGAAYMTHCCLEAHGTVAEWQGDQLTAWISTQNVTGAVQSFAQPLGIPNTNVRTLCDYMGGGFGSKFAADVWGVEAARLAKQTGRPVKFMVERSAEQQLAGGRPSYFAKVKLGAKKDGSLIAWDSEAWGTDGFPARSAVPLPYVFTKIPNSRGRNTPISTNTGVSRAWRAPNHPQAAAITMCALEDLAAKLNLDPLEFFLKNIDLVSGGRPQDYRAELMKGAEMIEWKKNWHPRGDKTAGPVKRGLGLSIHTWGGRAQNSQCDVKIHPDGSAEVNLASQDLGTGTRTIIALTAAETFGLPLKAVKVNIGDSRFPPSGGSGGSTTVGGVSSATRRGALDALEQLFAKVAPALGAPPDQLEAVGGNVRVKGNPAKSLPWKQACAKLGVTPIVTRGQNPGAGALNDQGVGGAQMADVSVDIETGIVKINKFVAVQDCGLILNIKTAESQVFGAMIMGVGYALFEERIVDRATGRFLNADMEFYKLAGLGDIGNFQVHMMTGPGFDERGVIGLGEPPAISPGAAISNAVANAIGVRVPEIPLTPDRVLAALEKGRVG